MRDILRIKYNKYTFALALNRGWGFDLIRLGCNKHDKQFNTVFAFMKCELWIKLYWGDNRSI